MGHIDKLNELERRIEDITSILESPDENTDMDALLLTTGKMFAEAEFILAQEREYVLDELLSLKPGMSANEQKVKVEARCAREAKLVRQIQETNKALGIIVANRRKIV